MKKKKNLKCKICNVHPDSYMYFGHITNDKVIGDEYFSVDI